RLVRQGSVDLIPGGVGIVDESPVNRHLGSDGLVDVLGLQREVGTLGGGGEDDAVEAELDFADVGDTGGDASFAFAILDGARCIGDVDGVLANAFAELTEAAAGAAGANDGGVELWEGGAEFLGNDRGKRQDGGRAGDLDGVARLGKSSARTERGQRE